MNPIVKTKWLQALRSGKFRQATAALSQRPLMGDRDPTPSFCCLGVLCEIYREETGDGEWRNSDLTVLTVLDIRFHVNSTNTHATQYLPTKVMGWAGLPEKYGANVDVTGIGDRDYSADEPSENGGFEQSLAALNDTGFTFEQIADVIERQL